MRSHTRLSLLCGAVLLFSASLVSAQPSWQLFGLDDRSINCILADDTTLILVGTDKGMSVYSDKDKKWYDFNLTLPVTSIARYSSTVIFAGAGNGGKSDAVYIGNNILLTPPYYSMRLQQYFVAPTAMAVVPGSVTIPKLYTGGGNIVSAGTIGSDTLNTLQPVKIPSFAFGVESPRCADLFIFGTSSTLYAGGYDRGVMAGPGSLLVLAADSLQTVRRLNVTALAQGSFSGNQPQLVIGTRDTGVLLYEPVGRTWTAIPSPNSLPVNHLFAISGGTSVNLIVAAFDSGVYTNNGRTLLWTEVGNIRETPLFISLRGAASSIQSGAMLAGTSRGVYIYQVGVGIAARFVPQADLDKIIKPLVCTDGKVRLSLPGKPDRVVEIAVYDESGKLYRHLSTSQSTVSFSLPAKGTYYYTFGKGNKIEFTGKIVYVK